MWRTDIAVLSSQTHFSGLLFIVYVSNCTHTLLLPLQFMGQRSRTPTYQRVDPAPDEHIPSSATTKPPPTPDNSRATTDDTSAGSRHLLHTPPPPKQEQSSQQEPPSPDIPYQYTAAPALTCVGCSIGGLVGSAGVQRLGNNAAKKGQGNLCKC